MNQNLFLGLTKSMSIPIKHTKIAYHHSSGRNKHPDFLETDLQNSWNSISKSSLFSDESNTSVLQEFSGTSNSECDFEYEETEEVSNSLQSRFSNIISDISDTTEELQFKMDGIVNDKSAKGQPTCAMKQNNMSMTEVKNVLKSLPNHQQTSLDFSLAITRSNTENDQVKTHLDFSPQDWLIHQSNHITHLSIDSY